VVASLFTVAPVQGLPQTAQAAQEASGRTVRVVGTVRDELNAISLPGVPVEVVDTGEVVYTDVDGRFVVQVPAGAHQIKVFLEGYQERMVDIQAGDERILNLDVGLTMNQFAETVTVTASVIDATTSTAEAQLIERKQAQVITDNVGSTEMKGNGDGDAAAAMQRVTGLSVVDNFVFVRGLGERYSNTTLNGSVIPTTEPDRKVVPLDLFPTGLIDNVQVAKSYVPDRSAEFAGGLVQITPLKAPTGPTADFSYSTGFNSLTTGKDILGGSGGQNFFGFDDGGRDLPSAIPDKRVIRGGRFTPDVGVLRSDLERLGELFPNTWSPVARTGRPNQSMSAVAGNRFGRLSVLGSYTQSYKEQYNTEKQIYYRTSGSGLSEFSNYDFESGTTRAGVGAVGTVAFAFSPTNRLAFQNFYTHTGKDEARTFEGFNSDIATDIRNSRLFWVEEDLLSNAISGEHFVRGASNSSIDWRVTYGRANRDEPDVRETLYERNGSVFVLADESQSGLRMFNALDDKTTDLAASWSLFGTQWAELPVQFKFGGSYVERTRDFSSRRFRFVPTGGSADLTQTPEQILTPANIGPSGAYELKEETRVTDAYDAKQTVGGFYAMTDLSLSSRTRLIAGARVERFKQKVNTFDLFDFEGDPDTITANLENTDVFPAVNLVYALQPTQNLRVSFSQTTNRPEFRELAPFEFTDIVGGRAVVGNPELTRALIQNVDVRWEVFPGAADIFAVSFFYKHFTDPIERIVEPTAQLRTSFTNADSARNAGLEFEARRRFAELFTVGANYTFVDSKITLSPAAAQVQTSLERPLEGQSKNLVNLMFEVGADQTSVRLLYNFFGERISDVGSLGLPDILEDKRGSVDVIVSTRLRRVNVRFSAENLTDEEFDYTQGGLIQRSYNLGRTFGINFGFSTF
jgi:outer membrane receptor protein involved in Fe transport